MSVKCLASPESQFADQSAFEYGKYFLIQTHLQWNAIHLNSYQEFLNYKKHKCHLNLSLNPTVFSRLLHTTDDRCHPRIRHVRGRDSYSSEYVLYVQWHFYIICFFFVLSSMYTHSDPWNGQNILQIEFIRWYLCRRKLFLRSTFSHIYCSSAITHGTLLPNIFKTLIAALPLIPFCLWQVKNWNAQNPPSKILQTAVCSQFSIVHVECGGWEDWLFGTD